ncbi:MAG: RNA polymerase sigma factor SigJ [Pseudomonadota bacterium]
MTPTPEDPATFEAMRPRLEGLAYRMLGSLADAEDAVQDTYVKWRAAQREGIESPEAWLVAVCTRRCLDLLRRAQRARTDYVGLWLPEPLLGAAPADQEARLDLSASLTTAFLLLLERLSPVERAAYLLREIFDYDYAEIAAMLEKSEPASRQIVARAKRRLGGEEVRAEVPAERQELLLTSFLAALESGRPEPLKEVLAEDVELWGDGGGKVPAGGLQVIKSAERVAGFLAQVWQLHWRAYEIERAAVNGAPGLVLREDGRVVGALSLAADAQGRLAGLYVVRNPDKLRHIEGGPAA